MSRRIGVVGEPPPEEGRRQIDRPAERARTRVAELRLEAEPPCRPLRRAPDGGEHDGEDDEDLAPEDLGRVHGDRRSGRRLAPTASAEQSRLASGMQWRANRTRVLSRARAAVVPQRLSDRRFPTCPAGPSRTVPSARSLRACAGIAAIGRTPDSGPEQDHLITAQSAPSCALVDAESRSDIWAECLYKTFADLFDMKDGIVARVANRLDAERPREAGRAARSVIDWKLSSDLGASAAGSWPCCGR